MGRPGCLNPDPAAQLKPDCNEQELFGPCLALHPAVKGKVTVPVITHKRMPFFRHMDPNLVHPPGIKHNFEERALFAQLSHQFPAGLGPLFDTMDLDGFTDFTESILGNPLDNGVVRLVTARIGQDLRKAGGGLPCFSDNQAACRIAIEPVHQMGGLTPDRLQLTRQIGPDGLPGLNRQASRLVDDNPIPAVV